MANQYYFPKGDVVKTLRLVVLALTWFGVLAVHAQQADNQIPTAVTVPNLYGLTAPQAAAALNAARLRFGGQSAATAGESQAPGTVTSQSLPAGSLANAGDTVDILVAEPANVRLIYDNNDLTLIHNGNEPLDVRQIDFQASEAVPVQFTGRRWGRRVEPGDCVQVWSTRRTEPKSVAGCRRIESWLSTTDAAQHVWKQSAGVERFVVRQDGIPRGECPAAGSGTRDAPMVCEIYLAQPEAAPVWPFVYLAYTQDTLIVHNASSDSWMRPNLTVEPSAGGAFMFNDTTLYSAIDGLVLSAGDSGPVLRQLAPNQCVRFRTSTALPGSLPEPCFLFGDALVHGAPFWQSRFTVRDRAGDRHICEAAVADTVTVCRIVR